MSDVLHANHYDTIREDRWIFVDDEGGVATAPGRRGVYWGSDEGNARMQARAWGLHYVQVGLVEAFIVAWWETGDLP